VQPLGDRRLAPNPNSALFTSGLVQARLAADPEWNGGWYYDRGGANAVLTELRVEMLKRNGIEAALAARYPDQGAPGGRYASRRPIGQSPGM
jgi:homoserine O-acetyltransferase